MDKDAHPLVWWILGQTNKLGEKARKILEKVDNGEIICLIPIIVLAELFYVLKEKLGVPKEKILRIIKDILNSNILLFN